jgi:hypothetical protein
MFGSNFLLKIVLTTSAVAVLATAALPLAASAGEVQNRFNAQQHRINRGVADGQLTRGEYGRDESHLRRDERERNADLRRDGGHLTAGQRNRLNRQLNRNSNSIYFTKHNRAHQPGA